jgi:Spy/CpxP family protein refolding chaperone
MTKKTLIGLILTLALVLTVSAAYAQGFGPGEYGYGAGRGNMTNGGRMMSRGHMNGGQMMGRGAMMGGGQRWNTELDAKFTQETAAIRADIAKKRIEMNAVLSAPTVDEAKAKALQADLHKLTGELSQKRLASELEFRKANPDWRPGFNNNPRPNVN